MTEYILETNNLSKSFGKQQALDNIALKVAKNSVYGLLGPNGAGKSTLLKIFAGILHKSSGEVFFQGRPWSRNDLSSIGALIEAPALYENLSARENLKVRTLLTGLPDSRIDEVLEIVDLQDTGKKPSGKFSLGMKQRLGIAIALLNEPQLLILDEPTNGLDPAGIQKMRNLIKTFSQSGITVILSSHILAEVEQMADHIGIINNGRLRYQNLIDHDENLEKLFMQVVTEAERG